MTYRTWRGLGFPERTIVSLGEIMETVEPEFLVLILHLYGSGLANRVELDDVAAKVPKEVEFLNEMWTTPSAPLRKVAEQFRAHGFRTCARFVDQMVREIPFPNLRALQRRAIELGNLVGLEAGSVSLIQIASADVDYYESREPFGPEVARKFSRVGYDVEEASRCIALDRTTAVVFHLMRVLEEALRSIAHALGIPDPVKGADRNWGKMLGDKDHPTGMWGELDKRNKRNEPGWKDQRGFYENIYNDLCAIKTAWRNPVMHVEGTYDRSRAVHIFNVVKGFMQHLVEHISQRPT